MTTTSVIQLFGPNSPIKDKPLNRLIKRLGLGELARAIVKAPKINLDPYLLLLLADQELVEGREAQARCLVEAAYEYFDRNSPTKIHRLHLAG